jgi:hypothetical protein
MKVLNGSTGLSEAHTAQLAGDRGEGLLAGRGLAPTAGVGTRPQAASPEGREGASDCNKLQFS